MFKFQIDGVKSFTDNLNNLKLNDAVILKLNDKNQISKEAIGIYTLEHKKIGYAPYKYSDYFNDFNFKIIHINLSRKEIMIGAPYNELNYIDTTIVDVSLITNILINEELADEIKTLKIKLEKLDFIINELKVLYYDENFIDINIRTPDKDIIFYTVSKSYYQNNKFKYIEFYNYKLIQHSLYKPFFIHRLDEYIKNNYTLINKKNITNKICYNHKKKIYYYV